MDLNISEESFEWEFQPMTYGELFARLFGPDWLYGKLVDAWADTPPDATPHRFREPLREGYRCVVRERVYLEEKRCREARGECS